MALDVLDIDFSGTTDTGGNLSLQKIPSPAYWASLKVIAQVTGNAIWVIQVNGRAVTFGRGPRVDLGPILLQPKDTVTVQILSAQPMVTLTGKFLGVVAGTIGEILANFSQVPNTIAVDVSSPSLVLEHVQVAANGNSTTTVILPSGAQAIGWQLDGLAGDGQGPSSVSITGQQTGDLYDTWSFPFSAQILFAVPLGSVDTSFTVFVQARAAAACGVYVIAWSQAPVAPLPATVAAADGAQLTAVSLQLANPALWQAPNRLPVRVANGLLAGVANRVQLLAGVAGQTIRVFAATLAADAAAAAGGFHLADGDPNAGGTTFDDFEQANAGGAQPHWYGGSPLATGNGLWLWADAAITVRGSVSVSQG